MNLNLEKKTMTCSAANKPITTDDKDSTIFVDVVEKLTLVFNRHASVAQQHINGGPLSATACIVRHARRIQRVRP